MKDKKNIIMLSLTIMVILISVGYSIFNTNLTINGTANIASTWNILFTEIKEVKRNGSVTELSHPTVSGTNATFDVDFKLPGDYITYQITVENKGTIDAIINKINATQLGSDVIEFIIDGIKEGDKLGHGDKTTFNVTIKYKEDVTEDPNLADNKLRVDITYIQDTGSNIPSNNPDIVPTRLSQKILYDNEEKPDTSIDFSKISSDSNGKGLYYTNKKTEDNKITYYFRGAVDNNYVSFGGYYWRIVRINEDGSIRLIYQGATADAIGEDVSIGRSVFNPTIGDNALVGYMYGKHTTYTDGYGNYSNWAWSITSGTVKMGTSYEFNTQTGVYTLIGVVDGTYSKDYYGYYTCTSQSTSCTHMIKIKDTRQSGNTYQLLSGETHAGYWSTTYDQAHANEVNSTIKTNLENWYKEHLLQYDSYIADTGFCNDRSLASNFTGKGFGRQETYYGSYDRLITNKKPQFSCSQRNDLFTVNNNKGNNKSKYKVGLITADEVAYAGGVYNVANNSYYLYTPGIGFWTMSSLEFSSPNSNTHFLAVETNGSLAGAFVWFGINVRPVINLSANVEITSTIQNGTITNPYTIKIN